MWPVALRLLTRELQSQGRADRQIVLFVRQWLPLRRRRFELEVFLPVPRELVVAVE